MTDEVKAALAWFDGARTEGCDCEWCVNGEVLTRAVRECELHHPGMWTYRGDCGHIWDRDPGKAGSPCPTCAELATLLAPRKGGPCETCQHCAQRTAGGNECSKTLRDITIEIDGERNSFAAFAGCAELGGGCWAWERRQ